MDAGCFDFTGWSRDALRISLDPIYESVSREQKEAASGYLSLFSRMGDMEEARFSNPPEVKRPTPHQEVLLKEKELLGFFLTGHPMDAYKEILSRLSCVKLGLAHEMDHDAIFRSAFIVETINVRISGKTQKKFAILTISDGYDTFELPMWPEIYEEKHHLLTENQLLYAVLQVDKKEETPRLTCKWVDDLTQVNEEMMELCDKAFDKAKLQAGRFPPKNKAAPKAEKSQVKKPMNTSLPSAAKSISMRVDASQIRLSHILKIKAIFEEHRGSTPLQLDFHVDQEVIATLHIEKSWGINPTEELFRKLKALPHLNLV